MHILHSFLFIVLGVNAAPAVVTEFVIKTARVAPTVVPAPAPAPVVVQIGGQKKKLKQDGGEGEGEKGGRKKPPSPVIAGAVVPAAPPREQKYFHEPGWDLESGHYDARYFRGKVPYEQHRAALRHLIRSYLATLEAIGVETWLAHGSLLGWWWNGQIMPWDYDLDVQVSVATLAFLGERYNRSMHEYEYDVGEDDDDEGPVLLFGSDAAAVEPNPKTESESDSEIGAGRGHSRRNIHGRAGSSSSLHSNKDNRRKLGKGRKQTSSEEQNPTPTTSPLPPPTKIKKTYLLDVNPHYGALTKGNGANVIDARWIDTSNGMFIDITGLRERDADRAPGVWSCKNNHRYRTAELWPLRRTEFEGAEAWIPYAFDKLLTDEYGPKCLVKEEWAG